MKTFNVVCKVVTPLFTSGANQQAELRVKRLFWKRNFTSFWSNWRFWKLC